MNFFILPLFTMHCKATVHQICVFDELLLYLDVLTYEDRWRPCSQRQDRYSLTVARLSSSRLSGEASAIEG